MNKAFDSDRGGRDRWIEWLTLRLAECLRVARPGAHALVWALPRTSHWTATAIEDAGWQIRDVIVHIMGQGFPKSLNVSVAIAKALDPDWEPGDELSAEAKAWSGWGTALKPATEHWILARKPLNSTVAGNVLEHGTGGLNVDGCRVVGPAGDGHWTYKREIGGQGIYGGGGRLEIDMGSQGHPAGRYPPNIVFTHHPLCEPCGTRRVKGGTAHEPDPKPMSRSIYGDTNTLGRECGYTGPDGMEVVPAWNCVEGCPIRELDRQSGERSGDKIGRKPRMKAAEKFGWSGPASQAHETCGFVDSGGASRFFPQFSWQADDFIPFLYCPKASKKDRGENNIHPCVKPQMLMRWLCRLSCRPGGTILDPFAGSGTTLRAARSEGFRAIGIESDPDYYALAARRLRGDDLPLFD
jgi:hypothetical protein